MADRTCGIDLGTTFSCIAYIDESGRPVVLPNSDGNNTTPSVVYFEGESVIVGEQAKAMAKVLPSQVAAFAKREMGNPDYTFDVDGKKYRAEEISALILRKVAEDAAAALGEPVTRVVITVPAYFGALERENTRNAGKIAGLDVIDIVAEPVAAAIAYGAKAESDEVALIYDFGGGTFDATIIRTSKDGGVAVVCTDGNHRLGGKDLDDVLIQHFARAFMAEHPEAGDPMDEPSSLAALAQAAEDCKKALSSKEKDTRAISHGGQMSRVTVTREEFVALVDPLLCESYDITQRTLAVGKEKGITKIDRLLLVGGTSKIPAIKAKLTELFGIEPQLFDPDQSVAKGAAMMGLISTAQEQIAAGASVAEVGANLGLSTAKIASIKDVTVTSVNAKGVGVIARNDHGVDEVVFLIHANSELPAENTQQFGTTVENQSRVDVVVVEQGGQVESPNPADARELTKGSIVGFTGNLPKGAPIQCTFRLSTDGTLEVLAREVSSGKELRLEVKLEGAMTAQEQAMSRTALSKLSVS